MTWMRTTKGRCIRHRKQRAPPHSDTDWRKGKSTIRYPVVRCTLSSHSPIHGLRFRLDRSQVHLADLRQQLVLLEDKVHPIYTRRLEKIEAALDERLSLNACVRDFVSAELIHVTAPPPRGQIK